MSIKELIRRFIEADLKADCRLTDVPSMNVMSPGDSAKLLPYIRALQMKMFCGHPFGFSQIKMEREQVCVKWHIL